MPHAVMPSANVEAVSTYSQALRNLLSAAKRVKPAQTIEPPPTHADLAKDISTALPDIGAVASREGHPQYAAIETAFRTIFYELLATTSIDDSAFSKVWNLLDLALIFGDPEWCEPALVFWLAEETLESQTIEGCQRVFDYLDSRRERMIAKHWKSKYLILLRACTDLLRRLSRAEDTVFCGRVFIYLFQSFPLGDKSAVNLRGEYHVENATIFDAPPVAPAASPTAMELDKVDGEDVKESSKQLPPPTITTETNGADLGANGEAKGGEAKTESAPEPPNALTTDELYPIFWSLQESFAKPTALFDTDNLKTFKSGLEATLAKFKEVQREQENPASVKNHDEGTARAGTKRKRDDGEVDASASSYNPKYLTNRDLFELEISDLSFRRHVLVQALILTEFLLAQTPKAKTRLASLKNKSVIYDFTLDEAEAAWATKTKAEIAGYLQAGAEGKFYYRMVDTVLGRDKNWMHWKAASCPPFQRPPVAPDALAAVRESAARATAPRRINKAPMGAVDIGFLSETDGSAGLAKLRNPTRCALPPLDGFERRIADAEFEAEMEPDAQVKERAGEKRSSALWRALRVAAKDRLAAFGPVDDGAHVSALFRDPDAMEAEGDATDQGEDGARTADASAAADAVQLHAAQTTDGAGAREDPAAEGTDAAVASEVAVN